MKILSIFQIFWTLSAGHGVSLHYRFEHPGETCRLPNVDVFVSTADPQKEPPLVTANVILSVLAVNYPIEK